EAMTGVVGREQRLSVDVKVEKVAYRVDIFCAVQTMLWHPPGLWRRQCGAIELAFEPRSELVDRLRRRSRPTGWRHDAAPQLPHHFFPHGPGLADRIEV